MKKSAIVCSIVFLCAGFTAAQESVVRERTGSDILFFEPHFLHSGADTHAVVIPYRIRHDFFVFTRSSDSATDLFSAKADVVIEIMDSSGNSITRRIDNIELSASSNISAELRKKYFQGIMRFHIPAGRYVVLFRVEDRESKRSLPNIEKPLIIPPISTVFLSSFIPVQTVDGTAGRFSAFNLGGDVLFSTDFSIIFLSSSSEPLNAAVTIKQLFGEDDDENTIVFDTTLACVPVLSSSIEFLLESNEVKIQSKPEIHSNLFLIPIRGSILRQGRYEMSLSFDTSTTKKIPFSIRWLDMPMSLNDLDIATYPLQYLLVHDDYSTLRRGSRDSRIKKFDDFWKQKDPTPATAYNEMMAEFYRRVDYTVVAYRTLKEPNGSLTDRGKIYILYGKPTSTERTLYPGSAPKEIWKYDNLNKTFIFEDPSKQGNYKLAESK